jgi:hypothetical protein
VEEVMTYKDLQSKLNKMTIDQLNQTVIIGTKDSKYDTYYPNVGVSIQDNDDILTPDFGYSDDQVVIITGNLE